MYWLDARNIIWSRVEEHTSTGSKSMSMWLGLHALQTPKVEEEKYDKRNKVIINSNSHNEKQKSWHDLVYH